MNTKQLLLVSLRSLTKHKTRSVLTTLGIIIGATAIITVMSIGEGAKFRVRKEIEQLGSNFIVVIAGGLTGHGMGGGGSSMFKQSLYDAITFECTDLAHSSPAVVRGETVIYEGTNHQTMVSGCLPDYFVIRDLQTVSGASFTDSDVHGAKKVALIGQTIVSELFDGINPIGKTIRIKNIPFKVIGVLDKKGSSPDGRDMDDIIFIPLSTAQRKLLGVVNKFSGMIFSAKDKSTMEKTTTRISNIIRQQHHLKAGDDDDFTVFSQDDIAKATDAVYFILNLLLLAVASIALIVGGIGIMNIMLVTVTERTKEIGIRMALGAQTHHILNQFLMEAIIICLLGGFVGVMAGVGASFLVCTIFEWPFFVSTTAIIISLIATMLIGLFFGYYPAYKASRLNPVDALAEH